MSPKLQAQQQSRVGVSFLLLTVFIMLTQGMLAMAMDQPFDDNPLNKDNDALSAQKRPAFFVGSRYGRSGNKNTGNDIDNGNSNSHGSVSGNVGSISGRAIGSSKARRLIIVPRNDRFFLGSRYGKRSNEYLSPYEQTNLSQTYGNSRDSSIGLIDNSSSSTSSSSISSRPATTTIMSCTYLGISNLYRCNNAVELNNIMNQLTGADNGSGSVDAAGVGADDANTN